MTSERRIIVSLADIRSVTCECKKCHYRVSLQPDDSRHKVPDACPGKCGQEWWERPAAELRRGEVVGLVSDFMANLREMRNPKQAFGFLLLFEFDEPVPASEA
jgi:hypothetical protein